MHKVFPSFFVIPSLMLIRDQQVLLLKRALNGKVFEGHWHLPAGSMEDNETPKQTIIRETFEEIGLNIDPELQTVFYEKRPNYFDHQQIWESIGFLFICKNFIAEPINKEPTKHTEMKWFDINNLPEPFVPTQKYAIDLYLQNKAYGELILV